MLCRLCTVMNFTTHTHSLTHSLTHSPRTRLRRLVLSAPKSDAPAPRSSDSISRCHTTVLASFARELRNRCQLRSLQYLYPGAPAIARALGRTIPRHKRSMLTFSLKNITFAQNVPWYRGRRSLLPAKLQEAYFRQRTTRKM